MKSRYDWAPLVAVCFQSVAIGLALFATLMTIQTCRVATPAAFDGALPFSSSVLVGLIDSRAVRVLRGPLLAWSAGGIHFVTAMLVLAWGRRENSTMRVSCFLHICWAMLVFWFLLVLVGLTAPHMPVLSPTC
jgi:hypothetical protein